MFVSKLSGVGMSGLQVSMALAYTAQALLAGPEAALDTLGGCPWLGEGSEKTRAGAAVAVSLEYVRDRVGVPRDLQLPAARQLRAHLNLIIDAVKQKSAAEAC